MIFERVYYNISGIVFRFFFYKLQIVNQIPFFRLFTVTEPLQDVTVASLLEEEERSHKREYTNLVHVSSVYMYKCVLMYKMGICTM